MAGNIQNFSLDELEKCMIPSSEEIAAVEHGDIITVRWIKKRGTFCLNDEPEISEKEYVSLKFLVLTQDANGMIVASALSFIPNDLGHLPKLYKLEPVNYGVQYEFILSNLRKIQKPVNFDKEKTRYISDLQIFEIEKFQKKTVPGGMHCCECNEFYHYATSNLSNGNLACWSCRDSYGWKYSELYIGEK